MSDLEKKALQVLLDQAKAKRQISACSETIGDNLESCRAKNQTENSNFDPHLFEAYKPIEVEIVHSYYEGVEKVWRSDEDVLKFLENCPYCTNAHNAVQERKKWKKKLASLRGTATKIGLAAMKESK